MCVCVCAVVTNCSVFSGVFTCCHFIPVSILSAGCHFSTVLLFGTCRHVIAASLFGTCLCNQQSPPQSSEVPLLGHWFSLAAG